MGDRIFALMSGTNSKPRSPWARQMLLDAAADVEATAAASPEPHVAALAETGSTGARTPEGGRSNSTRAAAGAAATPVRLAAAVVGGAGATDAGKAAEAAEISAAVPPSSSLRVLNAIREKDIRADLAAQTAGDLCCQGRFCGGIPISGPSPHTHCGPQSGNVCIGVEGDAVQAQFDLCRSMKESYRGASPNGRSLSCPEMVLRTSQTTIEVTETPSGLLDAGFQSCLHERLHGPERQQFSQETEPFDWKRLFQIQAQGLSSSEAVMSSSIVPEGSGCGFKPHATERDLWPIDESCTLNTLLDPVTAGDVKALHSLPLAAISGGEKAAWVIESDQGEMTSFPKNERISTFKRFQRDGNFIESNQCCGSRPSFGGGLTTGALRGHGHPSLQLEAQRNSQRQIMSELLQGENLHSSESHNQSLLGIPESMMLAEDINPTGINCSSVNMCASSGSQGAQTSSSQDCCHSMKPTDPQQNGDKMDLLAEAETGGVILKQVQEQMVLDALESRLTCSPVSRQDQQGLDTLTELLNSRAHLVLEDKAGGFPDAFYAMSASDPQGKKSFPSTSEALHSPTQAFIQQPNHVSVSVLQRYQSQNSSLRSSWKDFFKEAENESPEGSSEETALMSSDEDEIQPRGAALRSTTLKLKKERFQEKRRRRQHRNLILKLRQLIPRAILPQGDSAAVLKAAIEHIQKLQSELDAAKTIITMAMDEKRL